MCSTPVETIIAEFIATESLYHKIREFDMEYGQWFHLEKPLTILIDDN